MRVIGTVWCDSPSRWCNDGNEIRGYLGENRGAAADRSLRQPGGKSTVYPMITTFLNNFQWLKMTHIRSVLGGLAIHFNKIGYHTCHQLSASYWYCTTICDKHFMGEPADYLPNHRAISMARIRSYQITHTYLHVLKYITGPKSLVYFCFYMSSQLEVIGQRSWWKPSLGAITEFSILGHAGKIKERLQ